MVGNSHFSFMICTWRKGQADGFSRWGGYLNFASEEGLGKFNFLGKGDIIAFNSKSILGYWSGFNIQIACRASIGTCFPLSCQANFFSQGQSFGDFNLNGFSISSLVYGNCFFGAVDELLNC